MQLRITREVPVRRSLSSLAPPAFLAQMNQLQETARAAAAARVNMSDTAALLAALPPWANETEWFWVPQARVLEPACSLLPALYACSRLLALHTAPKLDAVACAGLLVQPRAALRRLTTS